MQTSQQLRIQAGISVTDLARLGQVNWRTADKFDRGLPIRAYLASRLQSALNTVLASQTRPVSVAS